ncbi:hypothetical protein HHI36_004459 [Cryptolaemus montrouzieri]|uniref:Uncharacterized protein n=1 Tax=Cryptolaemus montrouzieri TaxID=559131 RepID=A0ABD2NSA5_9CUCU
MHGNMSKSADKEKLNCSENIRRCIEENTYTKVEWNRSATPSSGSHHPSKPSSSNIQVTNNVNRVNLTKKSGLKDGEKWQKVKKKLGRKDENAIIGAMKASKSIKTIPRKAFIDASRFVPETKAEDLENMVKVMFDLINLEKAMNSDIWSYGVYVTRFFSHDGCCKAKRIGRSIETSGNFVVFHQNVQCLQNKYREIEVLAYDLVKKPQLLCLTVHWCKDSDLPCLHISGYNLVSSFCRTSVGRGESCIYAHDGHDFEEASDLKQENTYVDCGNG